MTDTITPVPTPKERTIHLGLSPKAARVAFRAFVSLSESDTLSEPEVAICEAMVKEIEGQAK
jgi:hypothetical protein